MGVDKLTMISATPSPFARMNRIALIEKGIPFELVNEVPWDSTTQTPQYNPLEQLPILLFPDSEKQEPVYDSLHIQEFIVRKYIDKAPTLLTGDVDLDLKARQILSLSEGVLNAFVLIAFETRRTEEKQSPPWLARQQRKIDGGMAAFESFAKAKGDSKWLIGDTFTIADIAVACTVAMIEFIDLRKGWQDKYPALASWWTEIEKRESFASTVPVMFDMKDAVV